MINSEVVIVALFLLDEGEKESKGEGSFRLNYTPKEKTKKPGQRMGEKREKFWGGMDW